MASSKYLNTVVVALYMQYASAQVNSEVQCDFFRSPNVDDCFAIMDDGPVSSETFFPNTFPDCGVLPGPPNTDPADLNCRILYCPPGPDVFFTNGDIRNGFARISATCFASDGSGGSHRQIGGPNDGFRVEAFLNSDFVATSETSAQPNATAADEATQRRHARNFGKRQQPGDDRYELFNIFRNTPRPGTEVMIGGPSPAGTTWSAEDAESRSQSIEASVEFTTSDPFNIFSASVGLSVGETFEVSSSRTIQVPIDCPSGTRGIIYWQPLFDRYQGFYQPSGNAVDWYVPTDSSTTSFYVECLPPGQ